MSGIPTRFQEHDGDKVHPKTSVLVLEDNP